MRWLTNGSLDRSCHLILAHGAGAPMTSAFLDAVAAKLDRRGITVHRFEFPFMAARTAGGPKRPAPRAEILVPAYRDAIADCRSRLPSTARLLIGGKSLGGRVACLAATDAGLAEIVAGVVVLGFPLHPLHNPKATRAPALLGLAVPALIVQGTRDPFGGPEAFAALNLPRSVVIHSIAGGDHDLAPLKSTGRTSDEALSEAADAIGRFASMIAG